MSCAGLPYSSLFSRLHSRRRFLGGTLRISWPSGWTWKGLQPVIFWRKLWMLWWLNGISAPWSRNFLHRNFFLPSFLLLPWACLLCYSPPQLDCFWAYQNFCTRRKIIFLESKPPVAGSIIQAFMTSCVLLVDSKKKEFMVSTKFLLWNKCYLLFRNL